MGEGTQKDNWTRQGTQERVAHEKMILSLRHSSLPIKQVVDNWRYEKLREDRGIESILQVHESRTYVHEGRITSSSPNRKYRKRLLKLFPCIDLIQTSSLAFAIGDLLIGALLLLSSAEGQVSAHMRSSWLTHAQRSRSQLLAVGNIVQQRASLANGGALNISDQHWLRQCLPSQTTVLANGQVQVDMHLVEWLVMANLILEAAILGRDGAWTVSP